MKVKDLQKYIIPAIALQTQPLQRVPFTSPSLNEITGGGVPVGMMTDLVGVQGVGKTSLALDIVKNAQALGKTTYFVDQEHAFDVHYAQLLGVDPEKLYLIHAPSMETVFSIIFNRVISQGNSLFVIDSVPWLVPSSMLQEETEVYDFETSPKIGEHARLLGQFCKIITNPLAVTQSSIIFINQYRANISQMSRVERKPAGSYVYHHAVSLRLEMQTVRRDDSFDEVQLTVTKNRTAAQRRSAVLRLVHGRGFDIDYDFLQYAIRFGFIEKKGSWYLNVATGEKVQGEQAAMQFLDAAMKEQIMQKVRGATDGTETI